LCQSIIGRAPYGATQEGCPGRPKNCSTRFRSTLSWPLRCIGPVAETMSSLSRRPHIQRSPICDSQRSSSKRCPILPRLGQSRFDSFAERQLHALTRFPRQPLRASRSDSSAICSFSFLGFSSLPIFDRPLFNPEVGDLIFQVLFRSNYLGSVARGAKRLTTSIPP
jgi:hypothetical protein